MEKPPIDIGRAWVVYLSGGLCIALGVAFLVQCLFGCLHYRAVEKRTVTLTAEVYEVEKTTDVDNNDVYNVYVKYEFLGKSYKIRYIQSTHSDWMERVGEQVEITIDSLHPNEQLKDMEDVPFFSMFFGAPLVAAGVLLIGRRVRFSYAEWYGITDAACRLDCLANHRRPNWGTAGIILLALYAIFGGIGFMVSEVFATMMVFSVGGLVVMIIFKAKLYKQYGKIPEGAPLRTVWTVADKIIGSDAEGDKEYSLRLTMAAQDKWVNVPKRKYHLVEVGDKIYSVRYGVAAAEYAVDSKTGRAIML